MSGSLRLFGGNPWHLVQRPLESLGNVVTKLDPAKAEALSRAPPPEGGWEVLLGGGQSQRLIHPEEFMIAGELLEQRHDPSAWEVLKNVPRSGVCLKRRAGESQNGPVTLLLEGHLPGIPVEAAAEVLNGFSIRSNWDSQQRDFTCHDDWGCPETHANGLFRFVFHVPPIPDRDLCNFIAVAKAASGDAYMTFCRDGQHPEYPSGSGGVVRGELMGNVMHMWRDKVDPPSTSFAFITKQDMKLGIIPHWVVNIFVPGELVKWKKKMERECHERFLAHRRLRGSHPLPLADFFKPLPSQVMTPASVLGHGTHVVAAYNGTDDTDANEQPVKPLDTGPQETACEDTTQLALAETNETRLCASSCQPPFVEKCPRPAVVLIESYGKDQASNGWQRAHTDGGFRGLLYSFMCSDNSACGMEKACDDAVVIKDANLNYSGAEGFSRARSDSVISL